MIISDRFMHSTFGELILTLTRESRYILRSSDVQRCEGLACVGEIMAIVNEPQSRNRTFSSSISESTSRQTRPVEMAMPGVHSGAHRLLSQLPRGTLADLGAGQGALSVWARDAGFQTTAVDFKEVNFFAV